MYTAEDIRVLNETIQVQGQFVDRLRKEIGRVIVGQQYMLDRLLMGLLTNGHILLEGVPGLAKTLTIKSLAQTIRGKFSRIQFTPDLLPADVIGTMIFNQQKHEFVVRKGPIFANFLLTDEINRAPATVQSALLEAQQDRFLMKVIVTYPSKQEEQLIIRNHMNGIKQPELQQVVSMQEVLEARELTRQIYMDEKLENYILDIVFATRNPENYKLEKIKSMISYGGSPRASINLALAAKANAFLNKRGYVIPEDVRSISKDVLRHRIGLTYEAEAENVNADFIIDEVLRAIQVP